MDAKPTTTPSGCGPCQEPEAGEYCNTINLAEQFVTQSSTSPGAGASNTWEIVTAEQPWVRAMKASEAEPVPQNEVMSHLHGLAAVFRAALALPREEARRVAAELPELLRDTKNLCKSMLLLTKDEASFQDLRFSEMRESMDKIFLSLAGWLACSERLSCNNPQEREGALMAIHAGSRVEGHARFFGLEDDALRKIGATEYNFQIIQLVATLKQLEKLPGVG